MQKTTASFRNIDVVTPIRADALSINLCTIISEAIVSVIGKESCNIVVTRSLYP